ncbi:hypothetical protein FHU38_004207 [Saccharomonospora amisosensis]|uniref:Uncharacterized protein n=1 Tax=Saccharomonospora amisosensis TaxID=1128677 RepID=A0A7X5UTE3_9PSEU|nr:hypothetical protein [Saccharomonospora amisosensis]NIJ13863.1 hypothetical protein [Saccharomonospora amisosensis]
MKLFETNGLGGTALSRTAGTVVTACPRNEISWAGRRHDTVAFRARHAGAADVAEVMSPEFLLVAVDLPTKKQPWVPLCPSERSP